MLKWARENGCPWDTMTCADAAQYGHLDVLKWAIENGCDYDAGEVLEKAQQLIAVGCFIGKSCTVLGCQTTTERETHLCDDHTSSVCDILTGRIYDDVLQLIVDMTAAC